MTTKRAKTYRTEKAPWVRAPRITRHWRRLWERPSIALRKYREYHALENAAARTRSAKDLKLMKRVGREPRRQRLVEARLRHYENLKKGSGPNVS